MKHDREWKMESDEPITADMAKEFQCKHGYHPSGYGFYGFKVRKQNGLYVATWVCARSCD